MYRSRCPGGTRHTLRTALNRNGELPDASQGCDSAERVLHLVYRLITLYQHVYNGIHAKSGTGMPLTQYYVQTEYEACMGWVSSWYRTSVSLYKCLGSVLKLIRPCSISQSTQPFELYLAVSPSMPKNAVVSAANAIARWINKEAAKLFLRDAPVF